MLRLVSQSWRSWKNAKALAILAVMALAVGIGCATAIFSVVHAVMLNPLAYNHSERWVAFFGGSTLAPEANRYSGLSYADLVDYQQRTQSFDVFGWYTVYFDFNLTSPGQPEHVQGAQVTSSLVDSVGVRPILGAPFRESDGAHVALISSRLWKRLGGDPGIIGKSITLNGEAYTVTGVMPGWFQLPIVNVSQEDVHNDVWVPVDPPQNADTRRYAAIYAGYARLKPGVTLAQATEDAKRVAVQINKEVPDRAPTDTVKLFGLRDFIARDVRPFLLLLLGAAGLLLLVTCANVAGLLVARSVNRAQETAVRVALGARKAQLALQFFFEGLGISVAAAGLGLLASVGLTQMVLSIAAEYIPRANEISTNGAVMLFAGGLAFVTAVLPAMAPLWQAVRTQPNQVLTNGVRATAGLRTRKLSQWLMATEIAFAFLLLTVSGLLIGELESLQHTWPGFDPNHLLTFQMNSTGAKFSNAKEFAAYQNNLLGAIEALSGVSGVAVANQLPLKGCCYGTSLVPEGQPKTEESNTSVSLMFVSPSYFKTLRIPLMKGRLLNAHDDVDKPVPVVIDEAAAHQYWPNRDPVGAFGNAGGANGSRFQVVGVVGNVKNDSLAAQTRPELYILNAQTRMDLMQFVVRSDLAARSLAPAVRTALQRVDPSHPIYDLRTMDEIVQGSVFLQRFDSAVVAFFALAALLLASLGIYSVTSYSVRERTVEIGTRMALGALRGDLLRLVIGSALKMAGYGVVMGAIGAGVASWLVMRFLSLHHIGPLPFIGSMVVVAGVATVASSFPAWRATLLSPMVAIRLESDPLWAKGRRVLANRVRREIPEPGALPFISELLTGFSEASRRADSFSDALAIAISDLREKIGADSVNLYEQTNGSGYRCLAASPDEPESVPLPANGLLSRRLKFHNSPLEFAHDDMDTALRWATQQKTEYVSEIEQLRRLGVRLVAPLRTKDEIIGLLLLGAPKERDRYSSGEKGLVQACAQELALMVENAHLTERIVEQERLRRDVALAAEVQEKLLPQKSIETEQTSVSAFIMPARTVGGDCYDFLNLGDGRIGIALADVAGKGVAAALIMAVVQASLRIIASEQQISLPELASRMNHFLFRSTGSNSYATFFYAQVDAENRQLRYVNAGHNPPYLMHARNGHVLREPSHSSIEELATGGAIIGMFPSLSYEEAAIELQPGDVMLAFTDGVTEALNPDQEEFGEERLKQLLCRVADLPVHQIVLAISGELRSWIASASQHDDLTFIVMKMK